MKISAIKSSSKSSGQRHMLAHAEGRTITLGQAVKAKCFECCGGYPDGRLDCRIPGCPIYPWMPYRARIKSLAVEPHKEAILATSDPKTV